MRSISLAELIKLPIEDRIDYWKHMLNDVETLIFKLEEMELSYKQKIKDLEEIKDQKCRADDAYLEWKEQ